MTPETFDAIVVAGTVYHLASRDELLHVLSAFRGVTPRGKRAPVLPLPPQFAVDETFEARARSLPGVVPSGYMSGNMARRVCESAGKRLCTPVEWTTACKGQQATKFPYGNSYADGVCNVFRDAHPAVLLHGDASRHHLDPRLNLIEAADGPLLRKTGATPRCRGRFRCAATPSRPRSPRPSPATSFRSRRCNALPQRRSRCLCVA